MWNGLVAGASRFCPGTDGRIDQAANQEEANNQD